MVNIWWYVVLTQHCLLEHSPTVLACSWMRQLLLTFRRFTMNTKQPQSEGVRRIVIVCSVVLSVLWVMCTVGMIGKINLHGNELGYFVICIVVSGIVLFFTPGVIPKLIYWISDGFSIDRRVTTNTKRPRSEGIRRIVLTCSVALSLT